MNKIRKLFTYYCIVFFFLKILSVLSISIDISVFFKYWHISIVNNSIRKKDIKIKKN